MSKRPAVDVARIQGIPRVKHVSLADASILHDADDALFLAGGYGLVADPWQAELVTAWLARRPRSRKWCHPRNGAAIPRQNGKNGALEIRELYGLVELGEGILHTSHQIKTSRKAFARLKTFFGEKRDDPDAKFPELNALVADVRNTNGQEAIFLKDKWLVDGIVVRSVGRPTTGAVVEHLARGGFIEFATRTGKGGRGTTYDLLVVDEAQHLSNADLAAIRPVISSAPSGNAQIIYLGTPPDPDKLDEKIGEAWVRIRSGAVDPATGERRATVKPGLSWIEFGAPDGPLPDLDDVELLYRCNPSLEVWHGTPEQIAAGTGTKGLDLETVNGERDEMTPADYARERLGWWGNPDAGEHRGVIDMDVWRALKVPGDQVPTRGTVVVDCSPDQAWTTVAIATDGPAGHVLGLVDRHEGTRWAPDSIKHLVDVLEIVPIPDPGGATDRRGRPKTTPGVALTPSAHHLGAALTKLGIEFHELTAGEVGAGCMAVQDMIRNGETHHVGQPTLDVSARQSITRMIGDTQQWDRRKTKTDISPLVAYSVAVQRWRTATVATPKVVAPPRRHGAKPPAAKTSTRRPQPSRATRRPTGGGFDPRSSGF